MTDRLSKALRHVKNYTQFNRLLCINMGRFSSPRLTSHVSKKDESAVPIGFKDVSTGTPPKYSEIFILKGLSHEN